MSQSQVTLGFVVRNQSAVSLMTNGRLDIDQYLLPEAPIPYNLGGGTPTPISSSTSTQPQVQPITSPSDLIPKANTLAATRVPQEVINPQQMVPVVRPPAVEVNTPAPIDPGLLVPKIKD